MKFTDYFNFTRTRPDRERIEATWIEKVFYYPVAEVIQSDGRIRRWAWIEEEKKYLRIVILPDGETIHNAFFDRRFKESE